MAEITAALVKELRDRTGAGMMDCKRALGDTSGDVEAAVDWLRTPPVVVTITCAFAGIVIVVGARPVR